ncbi:MAG TPA: zf-HC2 domain-containing protein [Thermoanaerobaculia bacterium]|nr:zf-HC2 domain-containing protein [Thermoanaerobaculia bacterium]
MGESKKELDCVQHMEALDLALDGALPAAEARQLEAHLTGCDGCREERQRLLSLREALGEAKIAVREGFQNEVMAALPAAGWQTATAAQITTTAPPRRAYVRAAVLLVALGGASTLFFTLSGGDGGPLGGSLAALVSSLGAALVAGAGLLGASWSGLGMAIGEMFSESPLTAVGLGVLLVCLSGLLVSMLRRRPQVAEQRDD